MKHTICIPVFVFFACLVAFPITAWAGPQIVHVPSPNGTDDTVNIQRALDSCMVHGPACTVQLAAGTYRTRQIVVSNFRGIFKGIGIGKTTVEAIYPLPVNIPDAFTNGECYPNTTTCLWPTLIMFIDGNISVSDLSIRVSAPPGMATTGWMIGGAELTDLIDAIRFMGHSSVNAMVDHVSITGMADNSPTSSGYNVINGVLFVGELPRSSQPWDYYVLSGSLTVRNSSFSTMDDGVAGGDLTSSHFTIGGSPSAGNIFDNDYAGMDLETAEKSSFEISYNTSSGSQAAMWVIPYHPWAPFLPAKPSQYFVHDNKFTGTGYNSEGFYFFDTPTDPWIQASAWNNTVELQNDLMEGIGVFNTKGTVIWNNTVTGAAGMDAIGLWSSSQDTVVGNNVGAFSVDPSGHAQIYLDPSTTHDLVVCAESSDTVLNQGTNNFVVGCDAAATSVDHLANSKPRYGLPKGKPWVR